MNKNATYRPAVDVIRVVSILAVVLIHTSSRTLETAHFNVNVVPWTLFLNQVARFAVPLFFLISGFVLELNHRDKLDLAAFFKKRFGRLFIPYLFWSAVYYWFVYTKHAAGFLMTLLDGSSSYQLYFIPSILILYLAFPVIHRLYGALTNRFVLVLLGLAEVVLLYREYFGQPLGIFFPLTIAILNYYVFLLGMVASHYEKEVIGFFKRWKFVLIAMLTGLAADIFLEGRTNYLRTYNYVAIYSQFRPSVMFYTLVIGGMFLAFTRRNGLVERAGRLLGRLAYFVFFVHVMVLEFLWQRLGVYLVSQSGGGVIRQLWFDPAFFVLTSSISFGIAYLAHKVPGVEKLTG
ncbi:MAG: acyltransferase [Deltaproteobacteria bacterium]|nr:acyltransferase [Deltaproteobacteria bacterium]